MMLAEAKAKSPRNGDKSNAHAGGASRQSNVHAEAQKDKEQNINTPINISEP